MKGFRSLVQKSALIDITLCAVILYLLYIATQTGEVLEREGRYEPGKTLNNIRVSNDVVQRIKSFVDARSDVCKRSEYFSDEKVTLISFFHNYQLYDLKVALLTATDELVGQVVIVDDGSTEETVINDALSYFNNYPTPVVLLRNEVRKGVVGVLQKAMQRAFYDAVVFMDTTVVCSRGWLPPLLQQITTDPNSIAVPHFDVVRLHPTMYIPLKEHFVATLTWNLNTILKTSKDFISPGLKHDIFVFRKSMLKSIGMLDWSFGLGGGGVAELGMRAWACGKSIKVVECSRVGLMGFDRPFKITSGYNIKQLVGVWFDDKHFKPYSALHLSEEQRVSIGKRRRHIFDELKCKGTQWYFKELSQKHFNVEKDAVKIGNLKVFSGSCASVAADSKVNLGKCDDSKEVWPEDVFQLTSSMRLISGGKCLTATSNAYILVEECRAGDRLQMWAHTSTSRLLNSATNLCACHVTDPKQADRQVVMVQPCEDKEMDRFRIWSFLPQ